MTEEERKLMISYLEDMKEEYVEGEGNERYPLPEWYMLDKVIKIIEQQPSENEEIIKVRKGTLKARTGKYVIYDVEWLKEHYNTTEAKIYGQPKERTEERTETHECDCISRQAVLEITAETGALETQTRVKALPSVTPQPKTGHWIEHKHGRIERIECSECGIWFLKADLPRKSYCPNCGSCNGDMVKNIMRDIAKTMSGGTK